MAPGSIRASDADRDRVAELLRDQVAQGRLHLDEFSERVGAAYAATTLSELEHLVADLPVRLPDRPTDAGEVATPRVAQGGQPGRLSLGVGGIPLTCLAAAVIFVALSSLPATTVGVLAILGLVVIGLVTVVAWWQVPTRGLRSDAATGVPPGSCCWSRPPTGTASTRGRTENRRRDAD